MEFAPTLHPPGDVHGGDHYPYGNHLTRLKAFVPGNTPPGSMAFCLFVILQIVIKKARSELKKAGVNCATFGILCDRTGQSLPDLSGVSASLFKENIRIPIIINFHYYCII
jgi:hypothetical protein